MSEVLWGVIIGGIIGNISGIATLWFSHNKWKKEFRLDYLKDERNRLEGLFNELYDPITRCMYTGIMNPIIRGKLLMLVQWEILNKIVGYIDEGIKTDDNRRKELDTLICETMRLPIQKIDQEIKQIVNIQKKH